MARIPRSFVVCTCLVGVFALWRLAAACTDYTLDVRLRGSATVANATRVATNGDYAYLVDGKGGLTVIDIADRDAPQVLQRIVLPDTARDVAVAASRLYVLRPRALAAYSLADPAAPALVGTLTGLGDKQRLAINWPVAICTGDSVHVIRLDDVSGVPRRVGALRLQSEAVSVDGTRAAVAYVYSGISLVDFTDQRHPYVLNPHKGMTTLAIPDVVLIGTAVYAVVEEVNWDSGDGWTRFSVYDANNPTTLQFVSSAFISWHPPETFERSGSLLYAAVGEQHKLLVYDVHQPLTPRLRWSVQTLTPVDLALSGTVGCTADNNGLQVFDVAPDAPAMPTPAAVSAPFPKHVAAQGTFAYLADGVDGLRVVDVSDPSAPVALASLPVVGQAATVAADSDRVYVVSKLSAGSAAKSRISTFDRTQGAVPVYLNACDLQGSIVDIEPSGRYLWTCTNTQVIGLDMASPAAPETTAVFSADVRDMALDAGRLYTVGLTTFQLFTLGDSGTAQLTGTLSVQSFAVGADAGRVYLLDPLERFVVVDTSNPAAPVLGHTLSLPGWNYSVSVRRGFAVVTGAGAGMGPRLIDVRDPDVPVYAGTLPSIHWCAVATMADNCVLMADGEPTAAVSSAALTIADRPCGTSTPVYLAAFTAQRVEAGIQITWSLAALGAAAEFRLIGSDGSAEWTVPHAADGRGGYVAQDRSAHALSGRALTYRLQCRDGSDVWSPLGEIRIEAAVVAAIVRLDAARPNPFNPRTTIEYSLPVPCRAVLAVYDLQGARVATLVDGDAPAGQHFAVWNGLDNRGRQVASGLYVARLATPTVRRSIKLTLTR